MTTLEEKVRDILDGSDFNDLPFEERKRIRKYMDEQQILTIWQTLLRDKHLITDAWRKKQRQWLANCVGSTEETITNDLNSHRRENDTTITVKEICGD